MLYEQIPGRPPWPLRMLLPEPRGTEGSGSAVGNEVRCLYERGFLRKRVTRVDPGRRYDFEVVEQRLTIAGGIRLVGGSYSLRAIDGGIDPRRARDALCGRAAPAMALDASRGRGLPRVPPAPARGPAPGRRHCAPGSGIALRSTARRNPPADARQGRRRRRRRPGRRTGDAQLLPETRADRPAPALRHRRVELGQHRHARGPVARSSKARSIGQETVHVSSGPHDAAQRVVERLPLPVRSRISDVREKTERRASPVRRRPAARLVEAAAAEPVETARHAPEQPPPDLLGGAISPARARTSGSTYVARPSSIHSCPVIEGNARCTISCTRTQLDAKVLGRVVSSPT